MVFILSTIAHIAYDIVMGACLAFLVIAVFSPGWRITGSSQEGEKSYRGLITQDCNPLQASKLLKMATGGDAVADCAGAFTKMESWEAFVLSCLLISAAVNIAALVWSLIMHGLCCCKFDLLVTILPIFGLVCFGLTTIGTILYIGEIYADPSTLIEQVKGSNATAAETFKSLQNNMGYSLILSILVGMGYFAATVLGILAIA